MRPEVAASLAASVVLAAGVACFLVPVFEGEISFPAAAVAGSIYAYGAALPFEPPDSRSSVAGYLARDYARKIVAVISMLIAFLAIRGISGACQWVSSSVSAV